ncbi:MAG: sodium:proton antiporter, partial [Gammaproteobacteria bacterium]|nr:sodium:proton antiporter [Gammaproteobacteria bacterium]
QILVLLTFFAFGCAMVPMALPDIGGLSIVYALLALTVLRMLPVSLSLLGTGIKPATSAFLGWFGPRGLASVLFVLLILEEMGIAHKNTIFTVTITTVALSILLHGVSAGWAARRYGAWCERIQECEEKRPVAETAFEGT